jgi:hypothetical protein
MPLREARKLQSVTTEVKMRDTREKEQTPPEPQASNWLKDPSIDKITKLLGMAAVFFYAVGFVIQNAYLARIGVTDFNLLQAKCILTGVFCAIWMVVLVVPIAFVYLIVFNKGLTKLAFKTRRLLAIAVAALSFGIMPFLIRLVLDDFGEKPALGEAFVIALGGCGGSLILAFIKDNPVKDEKAGTLIMSLACYASLGLIGLFVTYPMVSPQWGGGKWTPVVLLLNPEGRQVWHRLHQNYDDSVDPFVWLVHERENEIVLFDQETHYDNWHNGTAIVLNRKLIHGLVPRPGPYDSKATR